MNIQDFLKEKGIDAEIKVNGILISKVAEEFTKLSLQEKKADGNMPLDKSHICFERGHNFFLIFERDNGRSKYGEHTCSRCGHIYQFQFDYGS
jgi:hypothetical protein